MQSASSSCFSLGSTSCKTNSTSQFGHKTSLKLFAACFLKQSFHYLEETFRDTHSNLSLIKINIRPGQARVHQCTCSIAASALPKHQLGMASQKFLLWNYHYLQRRCQFLVEKNATQKTKRGSPWWMPATSAKGPWRSMALLSNLLMVWEGRREDVHLDKDCVTVQSLLVLGMMRLNFQAVLDWLRKFTSQDWAQVYLYAWPCLDGTWTEKTEEFPSADYDQTYECYFLWGKFENGFKKASKNYLMPWESIFV